MRRTAEVSINGVQMIKFGEYIHTLFVPTSLNMVRFRPLKGTGLITMEARLVFILVDNFFGGAENLPQQSAGLYKCSLK